MKEYNIFVENADPKAMDQFYSAMDQDFSLKGSVMPDVHTGYALPIGAVVATQDVVVPAWVGYDLNCTVSALRTTFSTEQVKEHANLIFNQIKETLPVGKNVNSEPWNVFNLDTQDLSEEAQEIFEDRKGFYAAGTLGGGNHFIEIGFDENNETWVIIHSGSRGPGHGIADYYMKRAHNEVGEEVHNGLDANSSLGQAYINDVRWMNEFVKMNHNVMLLGVVESIASFVDSEEEHWSEMIIGNHNHVEYKDGMWIHRKGATHAEAGMEGVIPGNMRDGSFIVEGLGNPKSLWSSSHGAGRVMGRKQAKREIDMESFRDQMKRVTASVGENTLDEAPDAYKDIFEVMDMQSNLVKVKHRIQPIINVKG